MPDFSTLMLFAAAALVLTATPGPDMLLIADESVSALDVSVQAQILDLLAAVQKRLQFGMLFITHDLRVASRICDRIAVMRRGQIIEENTPAALFADPQQDYTRELLSAVPGRHWQDAPAAEGGMR